MNEGSSESVDDLYLFLDNLKLSAEYKEYFTQRNITNLEDLQQFVAMNDYRATRALDDITNRLRDEQENLQHLVKLQSDFRIWNLFPYQFLKDSQ